MDQALNLAMAKRVVTKPGYGYRRSTRESSSTLAKQGGRPNQSQLTLPTTTTSGSKASGRGVEKLKDNQPATSNPYAGRYGSGGETASPIPRSMKLDVPRFSGADPDRWIFSITEYFTLLSTPVDQRLRVVGFNLEGDATEWFRWMTRNKLITTWDGFLESVQNRFGPCKYEDPQGTLSKLLQKGTVAHNQSEFEKLMNRVTDVSEALLISFYVSGLKPAIQRELLVSKPASLGDAFSLARVTEARLDDQVTLTTSSGLVSSSRVQTSKPTPPRVTMPHPEDPKTPLISTAPKPPLAMKWISPVEHQERLSKGLCFNCENKWVRGHKCLRKFFLLMVDDEDDTIQESEKDAVESGDISILNSLIGQGSPRSLQLWGTIGSGKGVKMDPKKVAAVMDWHVPTTQRHIRGFLGLAGYYRRFIKKFATVTAPLSRLLQKQVEWGDMENKAFQDLKARLSEAPILGLPNFEDMFIVEADASDVGIGALFAIVEAVYKWRQYLLGRRFTIRTDHRSLKELMQLDTAKLMGFNFAIEYKIGATNLVADALSRVHDEADDVIAAFTALNQRLVIDDLRKKNETLDELKFHNTSMVGHSGVNKMLVGMSALFYWKRMRKSIEDFMLDRFTKYTHFGTLPASFNAPKVAEVFMDMVVKHHGIPKTIVSDRDPIFTDGQTEVVNRGLEQYLRAMVSNCPQHWVRLLPWAEYSYNTTFHSSINMAPFQVVYGCLPPSIIPYPSGSTKVAVVEDLLVERDALLRQLKQSLAQAKNRMVMQANRKRHDVEYKIGDMVIVKLQPYRQVTLAKRCSNKLAKRYYGPFEVLERMGQGVVTKLPKEEYEGPPVEQPLAICDSRVVLHT
ncbi:ty3-gypsy retrotransposon protein [Tanacetum coccineum]